MTAGEIEIFLLKQDSTDVNLLFFNFLSFRFLNHSPQSFFSSDRAKYCYCYLQIPTLGCIISSDASRPASGFEVIFILESVTPPFITLPFVIGFPNENKIF